MGHPTKSESSAAFNTRLHTQWKADRTLRRLVNPRLSEAWRGCVGLAALLTDGYTSAGFHHGENYMVPADKLKWVCVRDVPVGHFPHSRIMGSRDVNYVTSATGACRHGMPVLDFREPSGAIDFRFIPMATHEASFAEAMGFSAHHLRKPDMVFERTEVVHPAPDTLDLDQPEGERMFEVLNMVSAKMTELASRGVDRFGHPVRPSWFRGRVDKKKTVPVVHVDSWFPRAYTSFKAETFEQLDGIYAAETYAEAEGVVSHCPGCHKPIAHSRFVGRYALTRVGAGAYTAECPSCHKYRKWHQDSFVPAKVRRWFSMPFRNRFTAAIAEGLPLHTIEACTYCGPSDVGTDAYKPDSDAVTLSLNLVPHKFKSTADGTKWVVYLPATATLHVKQGEILEANAHWADCIEKPANKWLRQSADDRWADLSGVCGGAAYIGVLQQVWYQHQAIRLADTVLFPSDLVSNAVRTIEVTGLWWSMTETTQAYATDDMGEQPLEAFVFPPVQVNRWDRLTFAMPGEVHMDATISDPRFARHPAPRPRLQPAVKRIVSVPAVPAAVKTAAIDKVVKDFVSKHLPKPPVRPPLPRKLSAADVETIGQVNQIRAAIDKITAPTDTLADLAMRKVAKFDAQVERAEIRASRDPGLDSVFGWSGIGLRYVAAECSPGVTSASPAIYSLGDHTKAD